MSIVSIKVKHRGVRVEVGVPNKHDSLMSAMGRPFEIGYRDMIKEGGKLITWMSRGLASCLPDGVNIISIEYFEEHRPDFGTASNVLPLISSIGCYNKPEEDILNWVKSCNGEPIFVHCEMGMLRSRWLAKLIIDACGYEACLKVSFAENNGILHRFIPHQF